MRQGSSYPKTFKAQVVQECLQPGEVVARQARHSAMASELFKIESNMPSEMKTPPGMRGAKR